MDVTPLMNDGFDGEPARRVLNFIQEQKKMFELAAEVKPVHVMDLPQLPEESEAFFEMALK